MERTVAQTLLHSSHTPAHLDWLYFQPLTLTFSVTSCHGQARERANGDMWPADSSFFFFFFFSCPLSPSTPFVAPAVPHENTVSRGMSKHAWPSFPCEPVRQDAPPPHHRPPTSRPTNQTRPPTRLFKAHNTSPAALRVCGTTNLEVGSL